VRFDDNGKVTANTTIIYPGVFVCNEDDLEPLNSAAAKAAAGVKHNCLSELTQPVGGEPLIREDMERVVEIAGPTCDYWNGRDFVIRLDENGFVLGVGPNSGEPFDQETAACVFAALDGLRFPCLANFDICPEYLIAE